MQTKIDEIMGLVEEIEYLAEKTRCTKHLYSVIENKLRELIREPLSVEQCLEIYLHTPDALATQEGFISHVRAIEKAHGITKAD